MKGWRKNWELKLLAILLALLLWASLHLSPRDRSLLPDVPVGRQSR